MGRLMRTKFFNADEEMLKKFIDSLPPKDLVITDGVPCRDIEFPTKFVEESVWSQYFWSDMVRYLNKGGITGMVAVDHGCFQDTVFIQGNSQWVPIYSIAYARNNGEKVKEGGVHLEQRS